MNDLKYVIFDFDGTIASSVEMALNIYNRIAPKYNCKQIDVKDIGKLSAENPKRFFAEYGVTKFKLFLLVLHVRNEMKRQMNSLKLVDGILPAIKELHASGFELGIVTSNAKSNVMKFLHLHGIHNYFKFVYSSSSFFGKERVLKKIMNKLNIKQQNIVYVGDETRDISASRKAGIHIVSVCWGLTSFKILQSFSPDQIAKQPHDLPEIIKQIFLPVVYVL